MANQETALYVGCGLTQAPEAFRDSVESLKSNLKEKYEVFDFIGLEGGTAKDVYAWDIGRCVANCTLLVAVCDYPSIGLGYEMATAVEKLHKPVLAVAHEKASITRLVLGIDAPSFTFERYKDLSVDVPYLVDQKLNSLG